MLFGISYPPAACMSIGQPLRCFLADSQLFLSSACPEYYANYTGNFVSSESTPRQTDAKPSFWRRYRESINLKQDFREIFIRPHSRYATLDGARAFTVLLMVLLHVIFGAGVLMKKNGVLDEYITGIPSWLSFAFQTQGSDPLFVICGLLVSYTLLREYDRRGSIDFKRFYTRRLMRIYPMFLLALLIYLPTDNDYIELLPSNLLFLSNYLPTQSPIIPVGWSLEVQMQFYLMLPALILIMFYVPWRVAFLVGLLLASFLWRFWIVYSTPDTYSQPFYMIFYDQDHADLLADLLHYDLDARIGNFFMGMLIAYLHHYYSAQISRFFQRYTIINWSLFLLACFLIAWAVGQPVQDRTSDYYANMTETKTFWFLVFDRYIYSLGISILLIQILCPAGITKIVEKFFSLAIWHPFAQLIFPIYLFHFPMIVVAAVVTFGTTDASTLPVVNAWQIMVLFCWSMVFTMIFGTVAHLFLEKPFITMRDIDKKSETNRAEISAQENQQQQSSAS